MNIFRTLNHYYTLVLGKVYAEAQHSTYIIKQTMYRVCNENDQIIYVDININAYMNMNATMGKGTIYRTRRRVPVLYGILRHRTRRAASLLT